MVFVAIVLCCLGLLMIAGFVVVHVQLAALADELREARTTDALKLATQLDAVADKQQGMRARRQLHSSIDDNYISPSA